MPGTLAENTFITMALATRSNYFAVVFLLYSETPEFVSCLSPASLPTKEAEKNLNVNLLWLYSDFFFFLSAKMNSWKITESNVKKNEHLLLKFLMSSVVFRACVTAVGRYWGWWDLSVSCAVVTGIVHRVCSPYSDGWVIDLVTKLVQMIFQNVLFWAIFL